MREMADSNKNYPIISQQNMALSNQNQQQTTAVNLREMSESNKNYRVSRQQNIGLTSESQQEILEEETPFNLNKETVKSKTSLEGAVSARSSRKSQYADQFIDHGWAWMVVFGCCMMHFLVGGFARSYSLIFMYLQDRFNSNAAVTAWVGGTSSAIRMLSSPVATALSNRYTARKVVMVGGILCGLGGIFSAFTPSTEYMFFSYSCLEGIGGALVYAPGIVMVGQYFDKYRSIAMGLSTAGSGLGVFCYPPIMQQLFERYGFFGAMLITGAVMFNNIISGAIYRPLPVASLPDAECLEVAQDQVNASGGDAEVNEELEEISDVQVINLDSHKSKERRKSCLNTLWLEKYLDLRLFQNPTFVLYVSSLGFITLSYISAQMLVPAFAHSRGISYDDSVWLISVIGISDMIGRIGSGFLFNASIIRHHRRHYYDLAILLSGLTHFLIAASHHYVMFVAVCTIHGLFTGVVVSQRAVICTDLMGVENLSSSFGLTIFVQGAGLLIGPSIAGLIKDLSGSYFYSYIFTGICSLIATMFLFSEWFLIARRQSHRDDDGCKTTEGADDG